MMDLISVLPNQEWAKKKVLCRDIFVKVKLNYKSTWPPKVYLVTDEDKSVLLDEESVACLDDIWVDRVNAVLNRYEGQMESLCM